MLSVRDMQPDDLDLGLGLCRLAGWNQLAADWERLLALAPGGVFVAEEDGRPCGTASTTCYGTTSAWIGMVLVHPDFRRHGIGSALMAHCIEHLRARRVEAIKLDATDQGRPVYLKLGFRDERPICRYTCAERPRPAGQPAARALQDADWEAVAAMDRRAFGADRLPLLRILAAEGSAVAAGPAGAPTAYGFSRSGFLASYLGPVVAADAESARAVVSALLQPLPAGPVFWDLFPENAPAREMAEGLGFTVARRLVRMYLGDRMHPGDVPWVYGAASFELG